MPATILPYNEAMLLSQVAAADEKAFRRLFEHYYEHIYNVAFVFTKSTALAEEIVQDVFLKIWLNREKLAGISNFKGYLFIVARNHIFNELRKRLHEKNFTNQLVQYFSHTTDSPEERLLLRETEQLISQAIAQLPPQQHKIYCLSRQQGLSQEEIAASLQISTSTVKSHMNKALHAIRNYLRSHSEVTTAILACIMVNAMH